MNYESGSVQKDICNSVENNTVEHVLRSYKIRARIFGGLKESKSKENLVILLILWTNMLEKIYFMGIKNVDWMRRFGLHKNHDISAHNFYPQEDNTCYCFPYQLSTDFFVIIDRNCIYWWDCYYFLSTNQDIYFDNIATDRLLITVLGLFIYFVIFSFCNSRKI